MQVDDINSKDKLGYTALHVAACVLDKGDVIDLWDHDVWVKSSALIQQVLSMLGVYTLSRLSVLFLELK